MSSLDDVVSLYSEKVYQGIRDLLGVNGWSFDRIQDTLTDEYVVDFLNRYDDYGVAVSISTIAGYTDKETVRGLIRATYDSYINYIKKLGINEVNILSDITYLFSRDITYLFSRDVRVALNELKDVVKYTEDKFVVEFSKKIMVNHGPSVLGYILLNLRYYKDRLDRETLINLIKDVDKYSSSDKVSGLDISLYIYKKLKEITENNRKI